MVASVLTKGGQFFCPHHGIAFPDFAIAGNTPRAGGEKIALLGTVAAV